MRIIKKKQKYFIGGTANFILMTLLINQWYLQSQKPLIIIPVSKKGENFSNSKVPESDWKGDFRVSRKSIYELYTKLHLYLQKKWRMSIRSPMSVEVQVVYYCRRPRTKTTNAFSISRASLWGTHKFPQCKEDNRWHPYWDSRTKWTLL